MHGTDCVGPNVGMVTQCMHDHTEAEGDTFLRWPRWSWWWKRYDIRSFAVLVLLVSYISRSIIGTNLFPLSTALYVVCMPINLQPYKKRYMSVIDSLIFATLTLLSAAFVYVSPSFAHLTKILGLILALELFSFVVYKLILKILFSSIKQRLPAVKQSLLTCNG